MIDRLCKTHKLIVTMEENVLKGGFGEACGDYLLAKHEDVRLIHVGVPDVYVEHGGVDQLKKHCIWMQIQLLNASAVQCLMQRINRLSTF
mgnify:CR=1 FL=1